MKYLLLFITLNLCFSAALFAQTPAQTVPSFHFIKLDQSPFTNENLAQKQMLFFFFFDPDCDHCQRAATNINQQWKEYKNTAVYLISVADKAKINAFINQYLPAFSTKQNATVLQDSNNEFIPKFQPIRYPGMFLYNQNKKLIDYEDNAESVFRFLKSLHTSVK
ncbi:MAG: redoxin domain-containing protein [Bacteroidota bacterium]|nr:redoxin domain-containing protein [Bacteroidota bacterium]